MTTGVLADLFCETWGQGIRWLDKFEGGPHEANFLKLDCSKIKKVFGWCPRYGVKEAVEKTVEWTKAYLEGADMAAFMDLQIEDFFK